MEVVMTIIAAVSGVKLLFYQKVDFSFFKLETTDKYNLELLLPH